MSQKVIVNVSGTQGSPANHEVNYKEGMTVQDALDAAGVKATKQNVTVAREEIVTPAEFGTRKLAPGETVRVTQRAQGS